jgi:diacylglycerol kinase (ATP)
VRPRNDRERLCLIVNPRSAGGATGRRISDLREAARRHFSSFEVRTTERPGHATELAAAAATEGFDIVAAVGGDGTCSEVVNGLLDGEVPRGNSVFTVVPAGTGSDLIRTLRIPKGLGEALEIAAHGEDRPSDVLVAEVEGPDGKPVRRLSINVTGFGMNGEVVRLANQSAKRLGGTLTFLGATVRTIATYRSPRSVVRWTDATGQSHEWEGMLWAGFAANGLYCGGGMFMGRGGNMQDGLIEVTIIPELPMSVVARSLTRLYAGTAHEIPGVVRVAARTLEVRVLKGAEPVRVDVDGEQPGVAPLTVRVLPSILKIRAGW